MNEALLYLLGRIDRARVRPVLTNIPVVPVVDGHEAAREVATRTARRVAYDLFLLPGHLAQHQLYFQRLTSASKAAIREQLPKAAMQASAAWVEMLDAEPDVIDTQTSHAASTALAMINNSLDIVGFDTQPNKPPFDPGIEDIYPTALGFANLACRAALKLTKRWEHYEYDILGPGHPRHFQQALDREVTANKKLLARYLNADPTGLPYLNFSAAAFKLFSDVFMNNTVFKFRG